MPRITVGNKEIVVNFKHYIVPPLNKKSKPGNGTKCFILAGENGCRDENKELVAVGEVRKFKSDTENRVLARHYALDNAFAKAKLSPEEQEAIRATIRPKERVEPE